MLALGSEENLDAYPGLREHAFKVKSFDDCSASGTTSSRCSSSPTPRRDEAERRRLLTFFVAGGGYSGSEIAGELADYARRLTRARVPAASTASECRVVVVHPGPTLLPELYGSGNLERGKTFPSSSSTRRGMSQRSASS